MALSDWVRGVATLATSATVEGQGGASVATVATVAGVMESATDSATPEQAAELRQLVAIVAADWPADEQAEALAVALANPADALTCFRALATERAEEPQPEPRGDDRMRTCRQCANLAATGRCLAGWRGEDFGSGIAVGRDFTPLEPDRPQRCAAYAPRPDDPDPRTGAERWPWLIAPTATSR